MILWQAVIPGRPTQKNSKRAFRAKNGKIYVTDSTHTKQAEASARSIIYALRPKEPFAQLLKCDVTFCFAIPKSKAKLRHPGDPCERHVDRGNLLKLIEDAMNDLVYLDDSQICSGNVEKIWYSKDETRITIFSIDPVLTQSL